MISIRCFSLADTDAVMDLWYDVTVHDQCFIQRTFWDNARDRVRKEYLPASRTWVAIDDQGSILGFVSLIGNLMGALFVKRDHQSCGIGRDLVFQAANHQTPLFVEVFRKNLRAISFYRRCEFVEVKRFIQEETGEQVIRMVKHSEMSGRTR